MRSRVRNVEAMPTRPLSRNSVRVACVPDGDDQLGALLVGEQHRDVLAGADVGKVDRVDAEVLHPRQAGRATVRIGVHDDLGAGGQRGVGDRVHVADDQVRLESGVEQRVGAAVDADEHRLELADVVLERLEVLLVVVAADHDDARAVPANLVRTSGTPTPSSSSSRSRLMYSAVLTAKASSWVDSPAFASAICSATVSDRLRACPCATAVSPRKTVSPSTRTLVPSLTAAKISLPTLSSSGMPAGDDAPRDRGWDTGRRCSAGR